MSQHTQTCARSGRDCMSQLREKKLAPRNHSLRQKMKMRKRMPKSLSLMMMSGRKLLHQRGYLHHHLQLIACPDKKKLKRCGKTLAHDIPRTATKDINSTAWPSSVSSTASTATPPRGWFGFSNSCLGFGFGFCFCFGDACGPATPTPAGSGNLSRLSSSSCPLIKIFISCRFLCWCLTNQTCFENLITRCVASRYIMS